MLLYVNFQITFSTLTSVCWKYIIIIWLYQLYTCYYMYYIKNKVIGVKNAPTERLKWKKSTIYRPVPESVPPSQKASVTSFWLDVDVYVNVGQGFFYDFKCFLTFHFFNRYHEKEDNIHSVYTSFPHHVFKYFT